MKRKKLPPLVINAQELLDIMFNSKKLSMVLLPDGLHLLATKGMTPSELVCVMEQTAAEWAHVN